MQLEPYNPSAAATSFSERYNIARRGVTTSVNPAAGQLLLHATQQGDAAACQALVIDAGASVAFRNSLGENCLHIAAQRGVTTVLELLLRFGADPNTVTEHRFGGRTPLHIAVRAGDAKAVSCLLDMQADPNIPDAFKKLPLHDAAALGDEAIVRLLLAKGSVPDANDKLNNTPYDYASRQGHTSVASAIRASVLSRRRGDDLGGAGSEMLPGRKDPLSTRIIWREKKTQAKRNA